MANKEQTALEWLEENMPDLGKYIPFGVSMELHAKFQKAKAIEKQQIIDAKNDKLYMIEVGGEQYYKETYGK